MTAFSFCLIALPLQSDGVARARQQIAQFLQKIFVTLTIVFILFIWYTITTERGQIQKEVKIFPSFFKIKLDFSKKLCYNNYRKKERWS